MDAVPVTLGQEFSGYAAQVRLGARAGALDAGPRRTDPARGYRDRDRPQHPSRVRRQGPREAQRRHRARHLRTRRSLRGPGQPRRSRGALRCAQDGGGLTAQDRQRPGTDGVRAARRARRDRAARAAKGLLDHARQGQPGDPRGRDPGRRPGDRQRRGDHAGGEPGPVRAQRPRAADRPQPAGLDQAARRPPAASRREVRQRDRAERGDARAPRRGDAGDRHRAQPAHRVRPGGRRSSRRPIPPAGRCEMWHGRRESRRRSSIRRSTIARWRVRTTSPARSRLTLATSASE